MRPRYLRLSVIARCNLHCFYCRPEGGCEETDGLSDFTPDELALLVRCAAAEGVRKVRITGGEPLLRDDLEAVVRCVGAAAGPIETTLTTNGIGLDRRAAALKRAGLNRVNISLDTLRPDRFVAITGQDRHPEVLAGIEAAARIFCAVKLNTVLLRGVNDDEIEALVRFAAQQGVGIRFIERYSSDGAENPPGEPILAAEVKQRLGQAFGALERLPSTPLSVEESYVLPSADGARVGVIASSSHPPCSDCAKLRFTAWGELRGCLFDSSGVDLKPLLQRKDVSAIRSALRETFAKKRRSGPGPRPSVSAPVNLIGG